MIWRRITGPALGTDPPPLRNYYPGFVNNVPTTDRLIVWVLVRVTTTLSVSGHADVTTDTGWMDGVQLSIFIWPLNTVASKTANAQFTSTVMIKSGGRKMPWQIVTEQITTTGHTGPPYTTISTEIVTTDITPGSETDYTFSVGLNQIMNINRIDILIPAEGVA